MKTRKLKSTLLIFLFATASLAGCLGGESETQTELDELVIAYSIKDDYTNVDENPQRLSDYLSEKLDMDVSLYPIDSEGAALQALRFGNADIAFMDGGAAWVGWQQYGLEALAADQKSDGRTYYSAHAVVLKDSDIAAAHLDDDPSTDPFSLMAGKTSCHTGWLKSAGMLLANGLPHRKRLRQRDRGCQRCRIICARPSPTSSAKMLAFLTPELLTITPTVVQSSAFH